MALSKGYVIGAATTPLDARLMEAARITRTAAGAVRQGVLWTAAPSGSPVTATSGMVVAVAATDFVVSRGAADGAVVLSNTGTVNVALDPAPNANSRIDVIWVKHDDSTQGDADSLPTIQKTSGNAASNPSKPPIPSGALEIATVQVPAGVTATNASGVQLTNTIQATALDGSPIRYPSEAAMRGDAANLASGATAYVSGGGQFYLRGATWVRVDATTFAVIQQQADTALASSTSVATLGGTSPSTSTSDAVVMPLTSGNNVVGPLLVNGWYEISWTVNWTSNSTGERYTEVMQNDVSFNPPAADRRAASSTSNAPGTTVVQLNAGDYVKLKGWQNSGSQLNYRSRLAVKLLRMS